MAPEQGGHGERDPVGSDPLLESLASLSADELASYAAHLMIGGGTPGPLLVKGQGVWVEDIDGNRYLDCTSQSWALYLGHCHPEIVRVLQQQAERLGHVHQAFQSVPRLALAKRLADILPGPLNRISFTVGGGPAIEAAMKIALRNRPGARRFISLYDSYHGTTLGTMGASWQSTFAAGRFLGASVYLPLLHDTVRAPNPYCYRCPFDEQAGKCRLTCARVLRLTLERGMSGPAAGVIVEPLQASAGQIICPREYLEEVRAICDEFEVPLIFDEIQTFARIGRWTAAEHYGVVPDIIVLGKGLGGGLPIAAIAIRDGLEGFSPEVEELHTFANSCLSQVTALKLLEVIERDRLLDRVRQMGEFFRAGLEELRSDFPEIGDIRAVGLHVGVEFVADPVSKRPLNHETVQIRKEAMKRGALFGLAGFRRNVLKIKPPFIISDGEARAVLQCLRESMTAVLRS